jgi:hypothetical protein
VGTGAAKMQVFSYNMASFMTWISFSGFRFTAHFKKEEKDGC